jgi:outer membrane protein assembly factor BamB
VRTRTVAGAVAALLVVAAAVAVATPVLADADVFNTDVHTAADTPLPPETGPLPASLRQRWTAATTSAVPPVEGAAAVATTADRGAGVDPATGRERWSYRRTNARLCSVNLRDGVVMALFAKSHGCRDLVALDAATGARRWFRTVEFTTDAVVTSGPGVAVVTGGDHMIAVDTGGGINRWTWTAAGCTLDPATIGRVAVATVARCAGGETRVVVHSPYADKEPWVGTQRPGSDPHVVTADERLGVLTGQELAVSTVAEDGDGKIAATPAGTLRDPRLAATGTPAAVAEADVVVIWTGSTAVAVDTRTRQVRWSAPASGPPALAEGQVLLAAGDGFTARPTSTGAPVTTIPAGAAVPAGAALSRFGRLVVAATDRQVLAYG